MKVLGFTEARQNLARTLDAVVNDHEETVIHRTGDRSVVIVSLNDWNAIKETNYLLSSAANAAHLRKSIADLDAGAGVVTSLDDVEAGSDTEVADMA